MSVFKRNRGARREWRVAFHNPFPPGALLAEREVAFRMLRVAQTKGWEAAILHRAVDIDAFAPDMVVSLHPQAAPKLTGCFTVGCHWTPRRIYEGDARALQNERSYDGWLVAGDALRRDLEDVFWSTARPVLTAPMQPSAPAIAFEPSLSANSRLFYIGSNWDGMRFPLLLSRLAAAGVLALHGHPDRWRHMAEAFVGEAPFDGQSVIAQASRCGLGLCLHLPAHSEAGIPNMRVFELAAAGALIVADRHPFILDAFGDSVLYVDTALGEEAAAEEIVSQVAWARAHPAQGRAMAKAAQEVFLRRFSLDVLFDGLPDLMAAGRTVVRPVHTPPSGVPSVELVVPVEPGGVEDARARLAAIAAQTGCDPVGVVLVLSGEAVELDDQTRAALGRVVMLEAMAGETTGQRLWRGLRAATADWIGVLPIGARPFPNHVASLLAAAAQLEADAVCAGVLQPMSRAETPSWAVAEVMPIPIGFSVIDSSSPTTVAASLHSAGILARRQRWRPALRRDPGLEGGAGAFLTHQLIASGRLANSGLLSMVVSERADAGMGADEFRFQRLCGIGVQPLGNASIPQPFCALTPVAAYSDLDPERAGRLPRLSELADFSRLPVDRPVYIYGASRGGRIVQLETLKWDHLRLAGFLDSSKRGEVWGLSVWSPEAVADALAGATIIIASQYVSEIAKRLEALGASVPYNAYPFIARHPPPRSAGEGAG